MPVQWNLRIFEASDSSVEPWVQESEVLRPRDRPQSLRGCAVLLAGFWGGFHRGKAPRPLFTDGH